jgi:ABC-type multidrug transport system ATPase subunit
VLFELLTCRQHLQLVCDLKNIPVNNVEALIQETL